MPAHHPVSTRSATRGAGSGRTPADRAERLDLGSTFVLGLRELGRRPGNALPVHRRGPLSERLGLEMIAVEQGADVDADLLLQSASEGVLVTGTVTAPATGECGRCLGPVETTVSADILELYAYPASLTEQTSDEDEVYRVGTTRDGNDALDVEPVLRDAIVLNLPLTPLCRPDCEGLCVDCGEPLAELPDDHHHELLDPRFAGLAALRSTLTTQTETARTAQTTQTTGTTKTTETPEPRTSEHDDTEE